MMENPVKKESEIFRDYMKTYTKENLEEISNNANTGKIKTH